MSDTITIENEYLACLESVALIAKRVVLETEDHMPHKKQWDVRLVPEHWYQQLRMSLKYLQEYRDGEG